MVIPVYDFKGKKVGEVELRPEIFEARVNVPLMHQAFTRQMANARAGTHKAKTRGEINRSKAKWYRQKGTGRARHGSRNANLFVGGGVTHGPQPRSYDKKMPRKMRRAALKSALSVKAADDQVVVLENLDMDAPKTKGMAKMLDKLGLDQGVLILTTGSNEAFEMAVRNLPQVKTLNANYLNIRDLLQYDHLVVPVDALQVIETILG